MLGLHVSANGLKVGKAKIDTIVKLPPSKNVKEIWSFLRYARFYKEFIKDFSKVAKPLCNLLEKDTTFAFDKDYLKAFEIIKEKSVIAPIMIVLDWGQPLAVMVMPAITRWEKFWEKGEKRSFD